MRLIDSSVIATRLRVAIARLFAVSNQAASLGYMCPASRILIGQIDDRLHSAINELSGILLEIEPKKVDASSVTLEDALILEEYQEIRRGLIKSWQFIEARERAIICRQ
jgi:hypothetical protein